MPRDDISMEERNDEWGKGCVVDGKRCFDCGDCCDNNADLQFDQLEIDKLMKQGHTYHCAARHVWGDGECECQLKGIIPGTLSREIQALGTNPQEG